MSQENDQQVPRGYWKDAHGAFIPVTKIKDIDKDRDSVTRQLCQQAEAASAALMAFKVTAMQAFNEFVNRSLAQYDAKLGGKKGNVTIFSFDGAYKIVRAMQENIVFDERLQVAQSLIGECIRTWSKGSNDNIKAIVDQAFKVDKAGKINTGAVLGLRALKIDDPKWLKAMEAISDSTQTVSTKAHIRFYKRDDASGEYVAINLDVASV
jgi:hypothetical protein